MPRKNYAGLLKDIKDLTPRVRELHIATQDPEGFAFTAGQFLMLHVPQQEGLVKRAYSIASDDRDRSSLKLLIKLIPGGIASEYVRHLKVGAQLEFSGPFGKLFLQEPPPRQVVFVCTGAGLSQHLSFLKSRCHQYPNTHFRLLFGVWNESEVFYESELKALQPILNQFEYQIVLDNPLHPESWHGLTGKVTDHLCKEAGDPQESLFYLCGNPDMIKAVRECLMDKYHIPKTRIFAEAFR